MENNYYSSNTLYNPGNYVICPLNDYGFEKYLSKNSQNYKYLSKYDPKLIKELMEEFEEQQRKEKNINSNDNKTNCPMQHNEVNSNTISNDIPISDNQNLNNKIEDKKDFKNATVPEADIKYKKTTNPIINKNIYKKSNMPQMSNTQKRRTPFTNNLIKFNNIRPNTQKINIRTKKENKNNINEFMQKYQNNGITNGPKIVNTNDYKSGIIRRTILK